MTVVLATSVCDLPVVMGTCDGFEKRWYYEKAAGVCLSFTYSGWWRRDYVLKVFKVGGEKYK